MLIHGATLREKIAASLREAIVKGELQPGVRLQEIEVADRYKASRTPVREAFHQLESEGFLVVRPRRGAVVAPITERDIREFYDIKSVLEGYAAECAVARISEAEVNKMQQLNDELERRYREGDVAGMVPVHNQFHEVFVHASGNERLAQLIKSLVQQFQRFRIALSHSEAVEDSIDVHKKIIQAFREKDPEKVKDLVSQNSRRGSESLVRLLKAAQAIK